MEKNKKDQKRTHIIHDQLFKWMISIYIREFFAHYFPKVKIGKCESLEKEFVEKYEGLKDSIEGDLFLLFFFLQTMQNGVKPWPVNFGQDTTVRRENCINTLTLSN
jgi:hypothetical protein